MLSTYSNWQSLEPAVDAVDAATLFNLSNYQVISTSVTPDGAHHVLIESKQPLGCSGCELVATRKKKRRLQRIRDIPVAGNIEVVWRRYSWYCQELECQRLSFFEFLSQVPPRHAPPAAFGSIWLMR